MKRRKKRLFPFSGVKGRRNPVPEKVILRLVEKLKPPTVTECHSLILA